MSNRTISSVFPLILASTSPRRKRLLRQIGVPFRPLPSRIDEGNSQGKPNAIVRELAEGKAKTAFRKAGGHWVIGADTVVVLGDEILGKPADRSDSASMLALLSGNEHTVITGFCILDPSGHPAHSEEVYTLVRIKGLTRGEIEAYIDTGEPFGKAGSYAVQGIGAFMVEGITGSYTNVVGLPVCEVVKGLLRVGAMERYPLP